PSTLALRITTADDACTLADTSDDAVAQYWAHTAAWLAALERADGDALGAHWARREELAARAPEPRIKWNLMYDRAQLAGLHGHLAEYEQLAEAARDYGLEHGQPDAINHYSGQLAICRAHQGRSHEMVRLAERGCALYPGAHSYRAYLAAAKARAGRQDEARTMISAANHDGFPMHDDAGWSSGITYWVEAAVLAETAEVAATLHALLAPYHDQIVETGHSFQASVAHRLGMLDHLVGDHDSAEEWFTEALALHERVRSPVLIAT